MSAMQPHSFFSAVNTNGPSLPYKHVHKPTTSTWGDAASMSHMVNGVYSPMPMDHSSHDEYNLTERHPLFTSVSPAPTTRHIDMDVVVAGLQGRVDALEQDNAGLSEKLAIADTEKSAMANKLQTLIEEVKRMKTAIEAVQKTNLQALNDDVKKVKAAVETLQKRKASDPPLSPQPSPRRRLDPTNLPINIDSAEQKEARRKSLAEEEARKEAEEREAADRLKAQEEEAKRVEAARKAFDAEVERKRIEAAKAEAERLRIKEQKRQEKERKKKEDAEKLQAQVLEAQRKLDELNKKNEESDDDDDIVHISDDEQKAPSTTNDPEWMSTTAQF